MTDDVAIGTILAWILGLGALFLDLFNQSSNGGNGIITARTLFGSIFGLDSSQAQIAAAVACAFVIAVGVIARPLLFSTLDPRVAATSGLPVTALGTGFLALVASTPPSPRRSSARCSCSA